jgi:hypothetical protein
MRRFLPLLIGATMTLLVGCVNKRELCAQASVANPSDTEQQKIYKDLGIKEPYDMGVYRRRINRERIWKYCQYYRN